MKFVLFTFNGIFNFLNFSEYQHTRFGTDDYPQNVTNVAKTPCGKGNESSFKLTINFYKFGHNFQRKSACQTLDFHRLLTENPYDSY